MKSTYVIAMGSVFNGMTLKGPFNSFQEATEFAQGTHDHSPLLTEWEVVEVYPVEAATIAGNNVKTKSDMMADAAAAFGMPIQDSAEIFASAETFASQYKGLTAKDGHVTVNPLERDDPATGEPEI